MTTENFDDSRRGGKRMTRELEEVVGLETGGYAFCLTCKEWHDDTHCFPGDHSRHCGHVIKTPASALVCLMPMLGTQPTAPEGPTNPRHT